MGYGDGFRMICVYLCVTAVSPDFRAGAGDIANCKIRAIGRIYQARDRHDRPTWKNRYGPRTRHGFEGFRLRVWVFQCLRNGLNVRWGWAGAPERAMRSGPAPLPGTLTTRLGRIVQPSELHTAPCMRRMPIVGPLRPAQGSPVYDFSSRIWEPSRSLIRRLTAARRSSNSYNCAPNPNSCRVIWRIDRSNRRLLPIAAMPQRRGANVERVESMVEWTGRAWRTAA